MDARRLHVGVFLVSTTVLLALAAGCAPASMHEEVTIGFGEQSTFGPRPVHREPAPGTYAHARSTGGPHTCETSAPSFFGEYVEYEVYAEGDDFYAHEYSMHVARIDGVGYSWSFDSRDDHVERFFKIRLQALDEAYERLMGHPRPRLASIFLFVEPADADACTPAEPRRITIPEGDPHDLTEDLIAAGRQHFETSIETLQRLPFTPRLPHPSLIDLFPATRGYASIEGYSLEYLAHGAGPEDEFSVLSIGFQMHTEEEPASRCGRDRVSRRRPCEHSATTSRGVEVFRDLGPVGSSSGNARLPHYYAKVGDTLVRVRYIYWSYGESGATGWRDHEFAPGELEQVFDSLESVAADDVVRFPGMSVGE